MEAIINHVKGHFWSDSESTQVIVYQFISNVVGAHLKRDQPQTLTATMLISNEYDKIWRKLATIYYEEFGKSVLDFEYYKTNMNPVLIDYYKEEDKPQT